VTIGMICVLQNSLQNAWSPLALQLDLDTNHHNSDVVDKVVDKHDTIEPDLPTHETVCEKLQTSLTYRQDNAPRDLSSVVRVERARLS
jgi:hypothetical protein